ncbi:hypothetical protein J4Q44_G00129630 [Coregonus suidteri]|uniref:Uncharacterized protein n=1 Tax=Coregonus suidteri TaxID=861788 RepID=A0AAN8LRZ2_9TELE
MFVLFYWNVFLSNHVPLGCQVHFLSWHSVEIMCVSSEHTITVPIIVTGGRWELYNKKIQFTFSFLCVTDLVVSSPLQHCGLLVCLSLSTDDMPAMSAVFHPTSSASHVCCVPSYIIISQPCLLCSILHHHQPAMSAVFHPTSSSASHVCCVPSYIIIIMPAVFHPTSSSASHVCCVPSYIIISQPCLLCSILHHHQPCLLCSILHHHQPAMSAVFHPTSSASHVRCVVAEVSMAFVFACSLVSAM